MGFTGVRVLVTGGAGFIGTALAGSHAAQAAGWTVLDNLLPQVHAGRAPRLPDAVTLIEGDVRDPAAVGEALATARPDVVIHLAAETGTGQSLDEPSRHTDVNVTGTARLLEALTAAPPQQVILASSRAVYGEGAWQDADGNTVYPGTRTAGMLAQRCWDFPGLSSLPSQAHRTCPNPSNVYGATKLAQEHLLTAWCASRGVRSAILRLQNVYGPGQSPTNPYTGITTLFLRIASQGQSLPVYEDGLIVRDFVFIDDVVRAIQAVSFGSDDALLADVGSGSPQTILDMARIVAELVDAPEPVVTGQYRLGDVRSASVDISEVEWLFAGIAPVSLPQGLGELLKWFRGDGSTT